MWSTSISAPLTPAFPREEYEQRTLRVRAEMAARGLDLHVCHNLANICYLTGFQTLGSYGYGHYAAIVPREGSPVLFVSDFESHNARLYAWIDRLATYPVADTRERPLDTLAVCLQEMGLRSRRIGFEPGHYSLTVEEWRRMRELLPDIAFVGALDLVDQVKQIKSPAEVDILRRAASLTTAGLRAAREVAREGCDDNALAAAMYQAVVSRGGEYFSLQPIVTAGARSGIPHSTFRRAALQSGDPVFLELSACVDRYSAPAMRTLCIGPPSDPVRNAADACRVTIEALMSAIGPGRVARDVAQEASRVLRSTGVDLLWHGFYGYSVGLTFPPMCSDCVTDVAIAESSSLILEPGMVFHCSISLRKVGEFGVACGDTMLITSSGCEVLTQSPRELAVC